MRIKHFILIAAVAMVASSCAHSFEAQETQQPAIGFGTWAEQLTKAESRTAGTNTFKSGDTFNVYGYKEVSSTKTNIFNGDVVTAKGATEGDGLDVAKWEYSPLRFWDPTASYYKFYAASPSGILNTTPVDGSGAYTGLFTSLSMTFGGHDNDVLVATEKTVNAPYSSEAVLMQFNHVASLIDVKVKKDAALPAEATIRITSASLLNIQKTGTFAVTSYESNEPVVSWTPTASGTYAWEVASLDVTQKTDYSEVPPSTTGTEKYLFNNFVLMPQTLDPAGDSDPTLHIEYKIVTQEAVAEPATPEVSTSYIANIPIKDFIVVDNTTNTGDPVPSNWAQGTHYTYTLTIGANAITFTASINDWTPVSGYRYLVQ